MTKSIVVTIVIIAVLFSLFYFTFKDDEKPVRTIPQPKKEIIVNEIINNIKNIANSTEVKNNLIVQKTLEDVTFNVNRVFDEATRNIPHVITKLAGFKGCAQLSYLMAKDKIDGGSEAEKYIADILGEYIIKPSVQGIKESQLMVAKLNEQLAKNHTDMAIEMASTSKLMIQDRGITDQNKIQNFINTLNTLPEKTKDIAVSTTLSSAGIALEAVFIKSTIAMAQRVLGAIAARTGTTVLASSTAAVADGLLPIGDIIGLIIAAGGAVWTAHDLYKAQYVMKDELTATLENAIREQRQKTLTDIENEVRRIANEYSELNRRTVNELITKI